MKRIFKNEGLTLVFYKKENDQKFSFYIENEPELTEQLLATVSTKRVKEDKIKYAVKGIFELLNKKYTGYYWAKISNDKKFAQYLIDNYAFKDVLSSDYEAICRGYYNQKKSNKMEKNPIIELSELIQRQYGESIVTRVTGKAGADHMPTVFVEIELPDGRLFEASGTNKKIAKQKAAEKALAEF